MGLGEGIAPSAATDMVARVIAKVCLLILAPVAAGLKG